MAEKLSDKYGLAPGTPIYVGDEPTGALSFRAVHFKGASVEESQVESAQAAIDCYRSEQANWFTIHGVHNAAEVERLGKFFHLHPLMIEDITNTEQRPKIEFYEDQIFVVLRLFNLEDDQIQPENVSLVLGPDYLLVFLESAEDYFAPVRARLRLKNNRIQLMGVGYLLFALLDLMIDRYFITMDWLELKLIELDERLFEELDQDLLVQIHLLRKEVLHMQRHARPLTEIASKLGDEELEWVNPLALPYFRDLQDHVQQVIEGLEAQKEGLFNLQSQYLALASQKMNEVMKFLTVMGSIFIPLTFIAGVYGMNFKEMPELEWSWGYYGSLGLMAAVAFGLMFFFWRKRWL